MVTTTVGGNEYYVLTSGLYQKIGNATTVLKDSLYLLILTAVVAIMCFANIFNFKNRKSQKLIAYVNIVLIMGLSFWCGQFAKNIPGGLETATYAVGMFLPVIAIIFCLLGIRGINNDDKLIRSADRLR
jgi:FtsH-binding integral membrane protein